MKNNSASLLKKDPYAALRYPEFRAYLATRFFLTFGFQIQAVVVGWYVYKLTNDPLSLGMIGLAEAIPAIMVALYGGHVADRSDKKMITQRVIMGMMLCSVVLLGITLPVAGGYFSKSVIIGIIYLMIFVIGIARGFYSPAAFSLASQIVPREHYANSSTWNSSSYQVGAIVGPALGGLLYGWTNVTVCFSVVFIFMLVSLVCISLFINSYPPQQIDRENIYQSLAKGIRFVFNSKVLLSAISLDLFSVFFGGAVALMPVFAKDILQVGSQGLGVLRAMPAIGAVCTMLLMARHSPMDKPWRNLLIAVTGFGISIICFGLSKSFYLSLICLFFEGAFDSVSVIIRSTLMQLLTPDDMRGRVSAVNAMFIGSSNELGAAESGFTAKLMGTVPSVVFGGCMTLGIVVYTYFKTRRLIPLRLEQIH